MPSTDFAPWLTSALAAAFGLRAGEVPAPPPAVTAAEDEIMPALASVERWRSGLLPDEVASRVAAAVAKLEGTTSELLAEVAAIAPAVNERRVDWAALGGLDLVCRLGLEPWQRTLPAAEALAAPFEVGRARLVVAARGLGVAAGGRPRLSFLTRLAPPGWSPLPLGPFLGEAAPAPAAAIPLMAPGAAWAAHLVHAGRGLFAQGSVGALELAEAALRGLLASESDRRAWDERLPRWRATRLWRRARQVEAWLLGGERPDWLAPGLGEPGVRGAEGGHRLGPGLRLQDGPLQALRYLAVSLGRGRDEAE